MASNDLTLVDKRSTVVEMVDKLPTDVAVSSLPASIKTGLQDLMVAFPAGAQQGVADKRRLAQIYCEACGGHSRFIVEQSLKHLRFHNPRNPFAPTPQDVFELCNTMQKEWEATIGRYYFRGNIWAPRASYDSNYNLKKSFSTDYGEEPGAPGCIIPDDVIIEFLHTYLLKYEQMTLNHITSLSDEHFARLPKEIFTAEGYEWLAKEQAKNARLTRMHEEHLNEEYVRHRAPNDDDPPSTLQVLR